MQFGSDYRVVREVCATIVADAPVTGLHPIIKRFRKDGRRLRKTHTT